MADNSCSYFPIINRYEKKIVKILMITFIISGCTFDPFKHHFHRTTIKSTPSEAVVFINEKKLGKTPLLFYEQDDKTSYLLKLEKEGYETLTKNLLTSSKDAKKTDMKNWGLLWRIPLVKLPPFLPDELNFELIPFLHRTTIKSNPSGAHVFINERYIGETPVVFYEKKVKIYYLIRLEKKGYMPFIEILIPSVGKTNMKNWGVLLKSPLEELPPSLPDELTFNLRAKSEESFLHKQLTK